MGNTGGRARGRGSKLPDDKLKDPEPVRVAITPREPTEVRDNITDIEGVRLNRAQHKKLATGLLTAML